MNKVYIVTSGCYSDYSIEAVFETEENAKKYVDMYSSDGWDDNYRYVEYICDDINNYQMKATVEASYCGNKLEIYDSVNIGAEEIQEDNTQFRVYDYRKISENADIAFSVLVAARKDETKEQLIERAKKVAQDKIYAWLATEGLQCELR